MVPVMAYLVMNTGPADAAAVRGAKFPSYFIVCGSEKMPRNEQCVCGSRNSRTLRLCWLLHDNELMLEKLTGLRNNFKDTIEKLGI
ncbi:Protein of unknown function [Gryllus bimaculatus]|nr:Protein of unknown function [Gryllus bimaculatus]